MSIRIVFMGTPEFAVPSLRILLEHGYPVVGVVTAPDKWGGRGRDRLIESAVKRFARERGLRVLQPVNLKAPDFIEELRRLEADLQVVVAFRMLPEAVWAMPPLGAFNLHGSLLPQYRGAAPINWAVINGETETGVTTFFLKREIDTGDVILQERLPIGENETAGEVHDRMMHLGAEVVLRTVQAIEQGRVVLRPQDDRLASAAPKLFHETCAIRFDRPAREVHNFIRGLSPYPAAWTRLDDKELKILRTTVEIAGHDLPPGHIVTDGRTFLKIATVDGFVQVHELQLEGRRRMVVVDFLNGYSFN